MAKARIVHCKECSKPFKTYPSVIKKGGGVFCTWLCKREFINRNKQPLTPERLMEALHYDSDTGIFTWRIKPKNRPIKIGDRAGYIHHKGYRNITIDGDEYLEHHLAWFYMTKEWPKDQIDHKNTKKSDNSWSNLRIANGFQQQWNRPLGRTNTTGYKGVTGRQFVKAYRYIAAISYKGKSYHLGVFDTPEEAHERYCKEAKRLHGEFFNKG